MKHARHLRLPGWQRASLYGVLALMLATGLLWLWARAFWTQSGLFGIESSPWQGWALRWHGVLATPALIVIGSLWVVHWVRGWRQRLARLPGLFMLAAMAGLVGTGTLLWYAGDDQLRASASQLHIVIGCALPLLLAGHIAVARRLIRSSGRHPG